MHKFLVFSIVLAAIIVFGLIFWYNFSQNQQEISNMPLSDQADQTQINSSQSDSLNSLDNELESLDLEDIDAEMGDLETELEAL